MEPEDLARILDDLGQRLGPAGEYVFGLAVRQVVIDAVVTLAWCIPVLVVTGAATVWGLRFTRRRYAAAKAKEVPNGYSYERVDISDYMFPWMFAGIGIALVLATAGWSVAYQVTRLLNPEYAALRDILGAIR